MKEKYTVTIHRHDETGKITGEFWDTERGRPYCPHGPAIRWWDKNGELIEERWTNKKSQEHRDEDKPSWIKRDPDTGVIYIEHYKINNLFDRHGKDLPSLIDRDRKTGEIIHEMYHVRGKLHRDSGKPARILKSPKTGVAYHESVWQGGHCISVIERDIKSGAVTYRGPPTEKHIQEFNPEGYDFE